MEINEWQFNNSNDDSNNSNDNDNNSNDNNNNSNDNCMRLWVCDKANR